MKKGLFNKQYGLCSAVIDGRKTMTRRICKNQTNPSIEEAKWKIGEVIAVAQSYEDIANEGGDILANMLQDETSFKKEYYGAGWRNAMFTKADLMPHRIRITNIRVERLQDISDEDCLKEGIMEWNPKDETEDVVIKDLLEYNNRNGHFPFQIPNCWNMYDTPRLAFADLIDKISGRGTWDSNPFVYVYDFELVK